VDPTFVVYEPVGGFGNKMLGLLSSLLLGMVTKRAVLGTKPILQMLECIGDSMPTLLLVIFDHQQQSWH
jgi:hypothetical protein